MSKSSGKIEKFSYQQAENVDAVFNYLSMVNKGIKHRHLSLGETSEMLDIDLPDQVELSIKAQSKDGKGLLSISITWDEATKGSKDKQSKVTSPIEKVKNEAAKAEKEQEKGQKKAAKKALKELEKTEEKARKQAKKAAKKVAEKVAEIDTAVATVTAVNKKKTTKTASKTKEMQPKKIVKAEKPPKPAKDIPLAANKKPAKTKQPAKAIKAKKLGKTK
jgi:hypothetical protein